MFAREDTSSKRIPFKKMSSMNAKMGQNQDHLEDFLTFRKLMNSGQTVLKVHIIIVFYHLS